LVGVQCKKCRSSPIQRWSRGAGENGGNDGSFSTQINGHSFEYALFISAGLERLTLILDLRIDGKRAIYGYGDLNSRKCYHAELKLPEPQLRAILLPEQPVEKHLHPGFELNLAQLEVLTDSSRCLAVRFKHGDLDLPRGSRLEYASPKTDIGKVRDACLRQGVKLVLTGWETWGVKGVIVRSEVSEAEAKKMTPSNQFRQVEHSGTYGPDLSNVPHFQPRSFGVVTAEISGGPFFQGYEAAEVYLQKQYEVGFRGRVMIQAVFPIKGGGAQMPFVAEIQITDKGLEINRDEVLLSRHSIGQRARKME